jgi:uncharacterized protein YeaO (DUF488 family)
VGRNAVLALVIVFAHPLCSLLAILRRNVDLQRSQGADFCDCVAEDRTGQMEVLLKRAYEVPISADGFRVLVDRLWPRGRKKADLRRNAWVKEIAPSTVLRKWFDHDPKRWLEFCKRYKAELKAPKLKKAIADTVHAARKHSKITLIYAAKDTEHNEAVVLQAIFKRRAG